MVRCMYVLGRNARARLARQGDWGTRRRKAKGKKLMKSRFAIKEERAKTKGRQRPKEQSAKKV